MRAEYAFSGVIIYKGIKKQYYTYFESRFKLYYLPALAIIICTLLLICVKSQCDGKGFKIGSNSSHRYPKLK